MHLLALCAPTKMEYLSDNKVIFNVRKEEKRKKVENVDIFQHGGIPRRKAKSLHFPILTNALTGGSNCLGSMLY